MLLASWALVRCTRLSLQTHLLTLKMCTLTYDRKYHRKVYAPMFQVVLDRQLGLYPAIGQIQQGKLWIQVPQHSPWIWRLNARHKLYLKRSLTFRCADNCLHVLQRMVHAWARNRQLPRARLRGLQKRCAKIKMLFPMWIPYLPNPWLPGRVRHGNLQEGLPLDRRIRIVAIVLSELLHAWFISWNLWKHGLI